MTWTPGLPTDAPSDDQRTAPAAGGDVRIGDTERQQAADELREHFTSGRIDVDEFSARLGEALRAGTAADLLTSLRDLPPIPGHPRAWLQRASGPGMVPEWRPGPPGAWAGPAPGRSSREIWAGMPAWLKVTLAVVTIWLAFALWPAWLVIVLGWVFIVRRHRRRACARWTA